MTLSDKQWEFLQALNKLIAWAGRQPNYKVTLACARCANPTHHTQGSFHYKGLAVDLNLFIDGAYQRTTQSHERMGRKWESLGGTWGGRFSSPDGNHYSWGETSRK
jgi:hypothetical protein